MTDLLIHNGLVLQTERQADGISLKLLPNHDVLVRGNRIEAIQPTGQANPSHFRRVIDASERVVMPGLINTHAHTSMIYWRGLAEDVNLEAWFNDYIWPLESNLREGDVYWGMLLGLIEMIEAGVTSVNDHYFYMDEAAQAVEEAGTRALLGWAMFSSNGMEQIDEVGGAFAQRWDGAANGRIRTCIAPHAPYTCDDDFLRASAAKAQRLGIPIHTHVSETHEQTTASLEARGITPVQVLEQTGILDSHSILAHVCGATPADIELLADRRVGIAHTAKTYLKLAMGYAPVVEFRNAGIPIGLGSDGVVSNNTLNLWEVMRLMALMQKTRFEDATVMPIPDVLHIATYESAAVLGWQDMLGELKAGKLADIILVDLNGTHHQPLYNVGASLVYNMAAGDVRTVIVNGEVVMYERDILTIDREQVFAEVHKRMERMQRRELAKRIQTYRP